MPSLTAYTFIGTNGFLMTRNIKMKELHKDDLLAISGGNDYTVKFEFSVPPSDLPIISQLLGLLLTHQLDLNHFTQSLIQNSAQYNEMHIKEVDIIFN